MYFMRIWKNICVVTLMLLVISCDNDDEQDVPTNNPVVSPPFSGTIFLDPDIITDSDYSTFISLSYLGQDFRTMFDRRVNDWITITPFLFNSTFDDDLSIEIQVNSEFQNLDAAEIEATEIC